MISIGICLISACIQLKYINNVSKMFNIMKIRFSKKKEANKKKDRFKRLAAYKTNINNDDESEDGVQDEIGRSKSITDVILEKTNEEDVPDWNDLSFSDKSRLFNEWSLVIIISNIFIIIGSIFMLITGEGIYREAEILIGFGTALAWFALPKSYENVRGYNIITNTIINSASILAKAIIGIIPVYLGFSFFAL